MLPGDVPATGPPSPFRVKFPTCGAVVIDPAPSATSLGFVAIALPPRAVPPAAAALAPEPSEVVSSPVAKAALPIAVAVAPVAFAPKP